MAEDGVARWVVRADGALVGTVEGPHGVDGDLAGQTLPCVLTGATGGRRERGGAYVGAGRSWIAASHWASRSGVVASRRVAGHG